LIELLVVIAILGLLIGIAAPAVLKYLDSSKASTAIIDVSNLSSALELYKLDMGGYPTTQEGLPALMMAPSGTASWNGPYLKAKGMSGLNDPWGHPFLYRMPGEHGDFDLWSGGPHGTDSYAHPTIANW